MSKSSVKEAWLFTNGMVMTFDWHGNQVPDLQGSDSPELREAIYVRSAAGTTLHGFDGYPVKWHEAARRAERP